MKVYGTNTMQKFSCILPTYKEQLSPSYTIGFGTPRLHSIICNSSLYK